MLSRARLSSPPSRLVWRPRGLLAMLPVWSDNACLAPAVGATRSGRGLMSPVEERRCWYCFPT